MAALILKPSKIAGAGVGVFTTAPINSGKTLPLFSMERLRLVKTAKPDFLTKRFCPFDSKRRGYWCPANFNRMSIGWYINHSKKPNVSATWRALRYIRAGEELSVDYGTL